MYLDTLVNICIYLKCSLIEFCELIMYTSLSSTNISYLTSLLPIFIHLISFSCLIALARNSSTTLNRWGESKQTCTWFSWIWLKILSILLDAGYWLTVYYFMFSYVPYIPDHFYTFNRKSCWTLSRGFLESNEMIMCFFFL